jgi:hypothetical protein
MLKKLSEEESAADLHMSWKSCARSVNGSKNGARFMIALPMVDPHDLGIIWRGASEWRRPVALQTARFKSQYLGGQCYGRETAMM